METSTNNIMKETINGKVRNVKREDFVYNGFEVSICYWRGLFNVLLFGGWDEEAGTPLWGFGTGRKFINGNCESAYLPGLDNAIMAVLNNIRNSKENRDIKDAAESALARSCVEFHLIHNGVL